MRSLLFSLLLLPVAVFGEMVRLDAGASHAIAQPVLKKIGAIDITPSLEVVGPKGEWPLHGLYWSVPDFKVVLQLGGGAICYWTEEDFDRSKSHREDSRRYALSILFDTEKKTFVVKRKS